MSRRAKQSRRLTIAGLVTISAATVLMMAWAAFPKSALATDSFSWEGQGFPNASCDAATAQTMLWVFNDNGTAVPTSLTINGQLQSGSWVQQGGGTYHFTATVNGTNFPPATASVTFTGSLGKNTVLTLSGCNEGQTTTTTTTETSTTTTPPQTTTTTTETSTTTTPPQTTTTTTETSTTTTPPQTTTTTTPPQTSTTQTAIVNPTSITSPTTKTTKTKTPVVAPTTVQPGGTAFTGFEDVVPLGTIALMLMTGGSGLLWAGSRRRRHWDEADDE